MSRYYLGIDIGGTTVKLGIVSDSGEVLSYAEESVSFDGYRTPVDTSVLRAAEKFLTRANVAAISGIGISATGQIDADTGVVAGTCGTMPGWQGSHIREDVQSALCLSATAANDANCVCLGETWVGAARGASNVICVTIGTGIGGGILSDGRLLKGAHGFGGEIGHFPTHAFNGIACPCGRQGCWERYASTSALVRSAKAVRPELTDGRVIFAAAASGDEAALRLIDSWTDEIAAGLIGLVHIFNPQLILIGGGVSTEQKLLIEPLERKVRAGVMPAFAVGLEVRAAALKNRAGLVGAVKYFMDCTAR